MKSIQSKPQLLQVHLYTTYKAFLNLSVAIDIATVYHCHLDVTKMETLSKVFILPRTQLCRHDYKLQENNSISVELRNSKPVQIFLFYLLEEFNKVNVVMDISLSTPDVSINSISLAIIHLSFRLTLTLQFFSFPSDCQFHIVFGLIGGSREGGGERNPDKLKDKSVMWMNRQTNNFATFAYFILINQYKITFTLILLTCFDPGARNMTENFEIVENELLSPFVKLTRFIYGESAKILTCTSNTHRLQILIPITTIVYRYGLLVTRYGLPITIID